MGDAAMFETVNALTADYRARITELEAALARLRAENGALKMERDEALDRADELERNAEVVSDEFEKDCWKAMRRLLDECNFPWEDIDPAEGVTADSAEEHIKTTLDEMDKGEARQRARAAAAEAKAERLEEALARLLDEYRSPVMAETDTVVARLRGVLSLSLIDDMQAIVDEAADLIARLQAENEALRRERVEARETFAAMMVRQSLATGHGDTFADLLREAEWQIAEKAKQYDGLLTTWAESRERHLKAEAAREAAEARAARLKEALVAQRAFILHWTDDVNGGLKPTLGSLRSALDKVVAALEA